MQDFFLSSSKKDRYRAVQRGYLRGKFVSLVCNDALKLKLMQRGRLCLLTAQSQLNYNFFFRFYFSATLIFFGCLVLFGVYIALMGQKKNRVGLFFFAM